MGKNRTMDIPTDGGMDRKTMLMVYQFFIYATEDLVRKMENQIQQYLQLILRFSGATIVSTFLALILSGYIALSSLLWTAIYFWAGVAGLMTAYASYLLFDSMLESRKQNKRVLVLLRRCLFEGQCINKRTRFHLMRNRVYWFLGHSVGVPGYIAVRLPVQGLRACMFSLIWPLWFLLPSSKPQVSKV